MPHGIHVLAGTNGAGKSSVLGAAVQDAGGVLFNPDAYAKSLRQNDPSLSDVESNSQAWAVMRDALKRALLRNERFAFETTLGGNTIADLLGDGADQLGAEVTVRFVGLRGVDLHIERVAERVALGGHDIPVESIRKRYDTAPRNLIRLMPLLKELYVFDNSAPAVSGEPVPVHMILHMRDQRIETLDVPAGPAEWMLNVTDAARALDDL